MTRQRAAIFAGAQTILGKHAGQSSLALQLQAATAALDACGLNLCDVDGLFTTPLGTDSWMMPSAVTASYFGLSPRHFATIDLAGASGPALVHEAIKAVEYGECEIALCVAGASLNAFGADHDLAAHMVETGVAHRHYEIPQGVTLPALYGLLAARYLHEFGAQEEQLASVAVLARSFARDNPLAFKRAPISLHDVMNSRSISAPLKLLDCSVICDGAGAIVVMREELAPKNAQPVYALGYGQDVSHVYLGERPQPYGTGALGSGARAFERAGVQHSDIDVALLYDCFTIAVLIELEDLGFCPRGSAGAWIADGGGALGSALPINTHGGLLSGGHPGLAGGFLHVVEAVRQLQGRAGLNQVESPRFALAHANGGVAGIHATIILGQEPRR